MSHVEGTVRHVGRIDTTSTKRMHFHFICVDINSHKAKYYQPSVRANRGCRESLLKTETETRPGPTTGRQSQKKSLQGSKGGVICLRKQGAGKHTYSMKQYYLHRRGSRHAPSPFLEEPQRLFLRQSADCAYPKGAQKRHVGGHS